MTVLRNAGFHGADVAISVHSDKVWFRRFHIAGVGQNNIHRALRIEAALLFDADVDDIRTDHYCPDHAGNAIGVIAPSETVRLETSRAEELMLRVRSVEPSIDALARCVHAAHPTENFVVLELTATNWTFAVVRGGAPWFVCARQRGGLLGAPLMPHRALPPVPRSPQQVRETEAYAGREALAAVQSGVTYLGEMEILDTRPVSGCVIGAGRSEGAIVSMLNRAQGIEFVTCEQLFAPVASRLCPAINPAEIGPWLVPVGLALRSCTESVSKERT